MASDLISIKFCGSDLQRHLNKYSIMNVTLSRTPPTLNCAYLKGHKLLGEYKDTFFHKYELEVPLLDKEQCVSYSFGSKECQFYVPAYDQPYNIVFTSCNGVSSSANPESLQNNDIKPLWNDILRKHKEIRYHGQIGGGDQIYCDPVFSLPCLKNWLAIKSKEEKMFSEFTPQMVDDVHDFYFHHYINHFATVGFKEALASIPFNFIWDDHDIFDGYGSYPAYLQSSPIFNGIFQAALRFYLLFQQHTNVDLYKSEEIGDTSHSSIIAYGPRLVVLSLDVRSERTLKNVVPPRSWDMIWDALKNLPNSYQHMIVNLTIPVCYPRITGEAMMGVAASVAKSTKSIVGSLHDMVLNKKSKSATSIEVLDHETWADAFSKTGAFKQIVNQFGEPELLDDMNDHWTAKCHEDERREFLLKLQRFSKEKSIRVTFLSGDVHLGGAGYFFSDYGIAYPDQDFRLMYQVVCSAVGNIPPPPLVVKHLHVSAKRIMFDDKTVEKMFQIFKTDIDDKKLTDCYLMGRRNWCSITSPDAYNLVFDLRMEKVQGNMDGETKSYYLHVPPLRL